jgi:hypothetical protein
MTTDIIHLKNLYTRTGIVAGNIEGYFETEGQWVNMSTVLDVAKPFKQDGPDFHELAQSTSQRCATENEPFPRKERGLVDHGYNVEQVDAMWLAIITYYIEIVYNQGGGKICVQVHRGDQGHVQLAYIVHHLRLFYDNMDSKPEYIEAPFVKTFKNVEIEFRNGYWANTCIKCPGAKYHICVSLVIGLHPYYTSGTMMVPGSFGQLDVTNEVSIYNDLEKPNVPNDLLKTIGIIQGLTPHFSKCAWITGYAPVGKAVCAPDDVHIGVKLVQLNGIFNPKEDAIVFVKK